MADSKCLTIAVTSGKGGVGKSNLVANLALQLGARGKKVLVLDADLGMANLDVIFGVRPRYTLYHVIQGKKQLTDAITTVSENVRLVAGGSGIADLADLGEERRIKVLEDLDQLRSYADFLLIDTGAGISPNVIGFLRCADEILLVSTPEPTAMADAYGIVKTLVHHGEYPKISVVVNRAASPSEAYGVSSRLITVSRQFLKTELSYKGFLLEDDVVSQSVRSQRPFCFQYPESKVSLCLRKLADSWVGAKQPKKSFSFFGQLVSLFARGR